MRIEIKWHRLIPLRDGSRDNLIYRIADYDAIPRHPGVYVFGRMRGEDHDILNKMGTRERLHHIRSAGSLVARGWIPRQFAVPKR